MRNSSEKNTRITIPANNISRFRRKRKTSLNDFRVHTSSIGEYWRVGAAKKDSLLILYSNQMTGHLRNEEKNITGIDGFVLTGGRRVWGSQRVSYL